jgi:hypothetical protein
MVTDDTTADSDAGTEMGEEQPATRHRPPPPDRPGEAGFPSRVDSRRAVAAANDAGEGSIATDPETPQPSVQTPGNRDGIAERDEREPRTSKPEHAGPRESTESPADDRHGAEKPKSPLHGLPSYGGFDNLHDEVEARARSRENASKATTEHRHNDDATETSPDGNDRPLNADTPSAADIHPRLITDPHADDRDHPIDQSMRPDAGPQPEPPEFTPEQLARLREAERSIRAITEKHGVSVDYTTHPIDPANAEELNKAITRMAHEYPGVFRHVHNIKVLDPHGMAEAGSGARTLGHVIHEGQRPAGGEPIEPGIYLNQTHFADKNEMDSKATEDRENGWNVSGTADGTLYHEFAHVLENQLRKNAAIRNELARQLKNAGLNVDPDSLAVAYPPGPEAIVAGLSGYAATKNGREMIAEGFSEWKLNQHPRPIARAIGTVIDRHFKEN